MNIGIVQQQERRLLLDRLTTEELREFLRLTKKAEGQDDVVEVEARRLTEPVDEKNPNENKAF